MLFKILKTFEKRFPSFLNYDIIYAVAVVLFQEIHTKNFKCCAQKYKKYSKINHFNMYNNKLISILLNILPYIILYIIFFLLLFFIIKMFGGNHPNKTTNYEIALVNKAKEEKKRQTISTILL